MNMSKIKPGIVRVTGRVLCRMVKSSVGQRKNRSLKLRMPPIKKARTRPNRSFRYLFFTMIVPFCSVTSKLSLPLQVAENE